MSHNICGKVNYGAFSERGNEVRRKPFAGYGFFRTHKVKSLFAVYLGVREIVKNYDVDGVIFDDYFYPYPVTDASGATVAFKDDASYAAYGCGKNRADWRRDNVNQMVRACYEAIKDVSEDVLFGVAPFGIWKNDDGKNGGSATKGLQS
ncbi:MAG: family 10 glycosylhydrolase, partial [Clostridia bacterium]|nr:family 10 glycosylhydrolase [Clostridia bacterium]